MCSSSSKGRRAPPVAAHTPAPLPRRESSTAPRSQQPPVTARNYPLHRLAPRTTVTCGPRSSAAPLSAPRRHQRLNRVNVQIKRCASFPAAANLSYPNCTANRPRASSTQGWVVLDRARMVAEHLHASGVGGGGRYFCAKVSMPPPNALRNASPEGFSPSPLRSGRSDGLGRCWRHQHHVTAVKVRVRARRQQRPVVDLHQDRHGRFSQRLAQSGQEPAWDGCRSGARRAIQVTTGVAAAVDPAAVSPDLNVGYISAVRGSRSRCGTWLADGGGQPSSA